MNEALAEPTVRVSTYPEAQRVFREVIARVERDAPGLFGTAITLDLLDEFERPFSFIQRLAVRHTGVAAPACHVFVKLFKFKVIDANPRALSRRVTKDFESTRDAHGAFAGFSHLGAVRPIVHYPDLLAIVTEQAAGETLQSYLQNHLRWVPAALQIEAAREALNRVGQWIRVFQSVPVQGSAFTIDDRREYIDIRLRRLVADSAGRFRSSDRAAVLEYIEALGNRIPPEGLRRVRSHSDMSLGNILVTPQRVTVLDFAMAATDTTFHDVAKVCLQLELLSVKPMFRGFVVKTLQDALLGGFGGVVATDPAFKLVMLQHRVNHLGGVLHGGRVSLGARLYNSVVARRHLRWLAREVRSLQADPGQCQ